MAKNGVEVIIVGSIKWLNEWNVQEQLGHSTLINITRNYSLELRKEKQGLEKCVKRPCRNFLSEDFGIQVIMDCRTVKAIEFRKCLGYNQQDPIMAQEQSILTKIRSTFANEKIFQHFALGYRIDAYFPKQRLAIEVDEQGHQDRDFECEIGRQKALEKELGCKFIRINPAKENFDVYNGIGRIQVFVSESNKKSLIKKFSSRLLELKFKSDNTIKTKCFK